MGAQAGFDEGRHRIRGWASRRSADRVRRQRGARPSRPTIRRTWYSVLGLSSVVLLATGAGGFALLRSQQDSFDRTTSQFQRELGGLANLQHELIDAEVPLGGILYELDRAGSPEALWALWEGHRAHIDEHFEGLGSLMEGSSAATLAEARTGWTEVKRAVAHAHSVWGTDDVAVSLANGDDPYSVTVWAPLGSTKRALATLVASVDALHDQSEAAAQQQIAAESVLGATVVGALVLFGLSGRRISRRFVRPLLDLRGEVARLRDGDLTATVAVSRSAGLELAELAGALADMARTLDGNHVRLRDEANTDGLTGLANRRAFDGALELATAVDLSYRTAVLLIDIDDFKWVNDSMGHAAGDEMLVAIAGRISAAARHGDTTARLGGDEFAIIVEGDDALGSATELAERVLSSLDQPVDISGRAVKASCSIGIADGSGTATADELVRRADGAMYVAKGRGKACFELFDPLHHASMLNRSDLKADLHRAVDAGQLVAHYQPIVDLWTDETIGYEALVRWQHPERGLLMPLDFIELAEESGDIVQVGEWVIDRACRDLVTYRAGSNPDGVQWMSVNVSGRQLLSGTLAATVRGALSRHGILASSLVVEITETVLMTDVAEAAKVLDELRASGVRVAIDDFGTGFSSLQFLAELPVDILKINRAFVANSGDHARAAVILAGIVAMGHELGLALIAEGIELATELHHLAGLGPMAGQGFLLARPMPVPDAADRPLSSLHASTQVLPGAAELVLPLA